MIDGDEFFRTATFFVLFVVLVVAVATDLTNHRIPNLLLWPALSLALMLHIMSGGIAGLTTAAGGLTLGLAMLLPVYALGGMGAGDVKLLGVVGSFLGPWGAVVAGMATMMAGAILGITVIVWQCVRPVLQLHTAQFLGAPESGNSSGGGAAGIAQGGVRSTGAAAGRRSDDSQDRSAASVAEWPAPPPRGPPAPPIARS